MPSCVFWAVLSLSVVRGDIVQDQDDGDRRFSKDSVGSVFVVWALGLIFRR